MSNREPYVSGSELPPETVQGYIDLRPEVAAIEGLLAARIRTHSESDGRHLKDLEDAEGEQ